MSAPDDDDLGTVLDQLAGAETPAELAKAHRRVTQTVRSRRRNAARAMGPLAQTYVAAMEQWDREKADGVSKEDRITHLEVILRAAWPKTRAWQYTCDACRDTGLVIHICRAGQRCNGVSTRTDTTTRRLCAIDPEGAYEHEYGVPCVVCPKSQRFRDAPAATPGDYAQAGRTKKSSSMTKLGRSR